MTLIAAFLPLSQRHRYAVSTNKIRSFKELANDFCEKCLGAAVPQGLHNDTSRARKQDLRCTRFAAHAVIVGLQLPLPKKQSALTVRQD